MKHTDLPWKVGYITAENEIDFEVGVETVEDNYWIGSTGLEEEPTGEANAEFICRACNSHYALLEALRLVMETATLGKVSSRGVNRVKSYQIPPETLSKVREVVAMEDLNQGGIEEMERLKGLEFTMKGGAKEWN